MRRSRQTRRLQTLQVQRYNQREYDLQNARLFGKVATILGFLGGSFASIPFHGGIKTIVPSAVLTGAFIGSSVYLHYAISSANERRKLYNNLAAKAVGRYKDNPDLIKKAIDPELNKIRYEYFSKHPPKNPYKVVKNPKGSAFSYRKVKI